MSYVEKSRSISEINARTVSVVVPNYNYSRYMRSRLKSIADQTYPIKEVVVLDDASTDGSVEHITALFEEIKGNYSLVANDKNSGLVFKQWIAGVARVSGEFVWIAEADDQADSAQVAKLVELAINDPDVALTYCDSKSVDENGSLLKGSYSEYYTSATGDLLAATGIHSGPEFVVAFLSCKNTILNVSSVLWRRKALLDALERSAEDLNRLRVAGDWRVYIECLLTPGSKLGYVAESLNVHRRHSSSVTHKISARRHLGEVAYVHTLIRNKLGSYPAMRKAQDAYLFDLAKQLGFGRS
ncbi:glycosyltransferase [Methylobacterium sp. J-078]|uniref:glycosyltransferase n=1 Tax=Methylobacterium sp. J-078 TaxID=2836657 RepID=UPI001FB8D1D5|nr:glycosyltransferase [Methylobacterium sp. J-078]MCJ2044956.1 glycosyltransferase [Methylobacterium sp. J-078]